MVILHLPVQNSESFVVLFLQGRQAMEWVISKVKEEAKDIARSANETLNTMESFTKASAL